MQTFVIVSKGLKERTRIKAEGFFLQDGTLIFHDTARNWVAGFPIAEVIAVAREDSIVPEAA